jgi:hypothetical protein
MHSHKYLHMLRCTYTCIYLQIHNKFKHGDMHILVHKHVHESQIHVDVHVHICTISDNTDKRQIQNVVSPNATHTNEPVLSLTDVSHVHYLGKYSHTYRNTFIHHDVHTYTRKHVHGDVCMSVHAQHLIAPSQGAGPSTEPLTSQRTSWRMESTYS